MKSRNPLALTMLALATSLSLMAGCEKFPATGIAPHLTKAQETGALRVSLNGDFSQLRSTQARIANISTVSITVDATGYSRTLAFGRDDLAAGGASVSATFDAIPPGPASVAATAVGTQNNTLATAASSPTVQAGQTTSVELLLQLAPNYVGPSPKPTPSPAPSSTPSTGALAANVTILDGETIVAGVVTTIAGGDSAGFSEGSGSVARFTSPCGIALGSDGNFYVADRENHRIRRVTPAGEVTTIAGGTAGYADGTGSSARFAYPNDIASGGDGYLYVADQGGNRIRKVTLAGEVTTVAGDGSDGYSDGTGVDARFSSPSGIAVDLDGNLLVADNGNNRIRKVTLHGEVTTIAGDGMPGYVNGTRLGARFNAPSGVCVDNAGTIYVADDLTPGNMAKANCSPLGNKTYGGPHETQSTHGRADHRHPQRGGGGPDHRRALPGEGHLRGDLLQLAQEVRRHGGERGQAPEAA